MSATVTHTEADVCNFVEALRQLPDHQVSALRADFSHPSCAGLSSNLALKPAALSARAVSWAFPDPRSRSRLGGYRGGDQNARA